MSTNWTHDDLPDADDVSEKYHLWVSQVITVLDAVVSHLNAHHPKPDPGAMSENYTPEGVDIVMRNLADARRERDAAVERAEAAERVLRERDEQEDDATRAACERAEQAENARDTATTRAEQLEKALAGSRDAHQRSADAHMEWKARAEAAERELADEYSEVNQKAAAWDRVASHPALRDLPDGRDGSYAGMVFERITWLFEAAEDAEARATLAEQERENWRITAINRADPAVSQDPLDMSVRELVRAVVSEAKNAH